MDNKQSGLDFETMKGKALDQLRKGESLYGKDGAFAPLLKQFLESALEAEMDSHLDELERSGSNRRNGTSSKHVPHLGWDHSAWHAAGPSFQFWAAIGQETGDDPRQQPWKEGKNLSVSDTTNAYVINESAATTYAFHNPEDAMGKIIGQKRWDSPIVVWFKTFTLEIFMSRLNP